MAATKDLFLSISIANLARIHRITNRVLPWRTARSDRDFAEKWKLHNEPRAGFS
jgi:hypothetical protein